MPEKETFWAHLSELRLRLIYCVIFLVLGVIFSITMAPTIVKLLLSPTLAIDFPLEFHTFAPPEVVIFILKVVLWAGVVVSFPFWLGQLVLFVLPALRAREKKIFWGIILGGVLLFGGGILFSHLIVLPLVLKFLIKFNQRWGIKPLWNIHEYVNFLFSFYLVFGVSFLLPEVMVLLSYTGILKPEVVSNLRKYILLGLAVAAALLTPPDVISQILLIGPVWILFELGLIVGRFVYSGSQSS